jgi:hypothetical protein
LDLTLKAAAGNVGPITHVSAGQREERMSLSIKS